MTTAAEAMHYAAWIAGKSPPPGELLIEIRAENPDCGIGEVWARAKRLQREAARRRTLKRIEEGE